MQPLWTGVGGLWVSSSDLSEGLLRGRERDEEVLINTDVDKEKDGDTG